MSSTINHYVKRVLVQGPGKSDSEVVLSDGFNVIQGPSNTGKSLIFKCLEYAFGAKQDVILGLAELGYEKVTVEIATDQGSIQLSRAISEKDANISSTDNRIKSGPYSTDSRSTSKPTLNSVLLRLCGVEDEVFIPANRNWKKQRLTWRTVRETFVIDEGQIISPKSVWAPVQNTAATGLLSALLFFITGEDYLLDKPEKESDDVLKERAEIRVQLLQKLSVIQDEIQGRITPEDVEGVEDCEKLIENVEAQLIRNSEKIGELIKEKSVAEEALHECSVNIDRFQMLRSQYEADLDRLSFIADGSLQSDYPATELECPLCAGTITEDTPDQLISYAQSEYQRTARLMIGLDEAIEEERNELSKYEIKISDCNAEIEKTKLENAELQPILRDYQTKLSQVEAAIAAQSQVALLKDLSEQIAQEITSRSNDSAVEVPVYRPKNRINSDLQSSIRSQLRSILERGSFKNAASVDFDVEKLDIVVNGMAKSEYGKGYRAYLNTVMSLATVNLLYDQGAYHPLSVVYDSPLISLTEPDNDEDTISDPMRKGLLQALSDTAASCQVIVIENDIGEFVPSNTTVVQFTKKENAGRYGFLADHRD